MSKQQKGEGFTIIEVVLVLAIAGLIFLIVFLAVPALQRSQRDTQRRNDAARFMSQISNYQANNKGKVPSSASGAAADTVGTFVTNYLDNGSGSPDNWKDPSSGAVYARVANIANNPSATGEWNYYTGYICDGETPTSTGASTRNVAFVMKLEGAGSYCATNK